MEQHLFFQLIVPFMEVKEMIRLRVVSKSWKTHFESILSDNFTRTFNRSRPSSNLIQDYAEELKSEAHGHYWIHHPWYGYFTELPEELKKHRKRIAKMISLKYEQAMYEKHWWNHHSQHNESGRNKCAREQPFIEFKYLERKTNPGGKLWLKFHVCIRADEYKRSCWTSGGNINVVIDL